MPPYRAQTGGMFGSGMQPRPGGNIDISSAIREVGNQASSLIQGAYLRKVAQQQRAQAEAAAAQAAQDRAEALRAERERRLDEKFFRQQQLELERQKLAASAAPKPETRIVDGQTVTIGADGRATAAPIAGYVAPVKAEGARNIDPLSPAGIEAAKARARALQEASPAGAVTGRAPTEAQEKSALFFGLMEKATGEMERIERQHGPSLRPLAIKAALGLWGGNYILNDAEQAYLKAARDFTAGVLRKESGAAIKDDELRQTMARYIYMPGDAKSVISNKAASRSQYMEMMRRAALPAMRYYEAVERNGLPAETRPDETRTAPRYKLPFDPDDPE